MGFLPSFILVNYYLDDLDRKIKEEINPIYYGRYNNEIIIVDKVLDKFYSEKYKDIKKEAFLLDYLTEEIFFLERGKLEKTESYLIVGDRNNDFNNLLVRKDNLTVINIKKSDSEEPIRRLKDNIRKYFEEPKILPEDLELFNGNYSEVFSSINNLIIELKDLRRIKIDESKLERLIEKQLILNKLIEGKYKEVQYEKDRINSNKSLKIEDVLSEEIIINCYKSWENIINCYIIGKKINSLYEFLDLINQAIEKIDISNLNLNKIEKIKLENNIRETLKNHLSEVISRALHLGFNWKKEKLLKNLEAPPFNY